MCVYVCVCGCDGNLPACSRRWRLKMRAISHRCAPRTTSAVCFGRVDVLSDTMYLTNTQLRACLASPVNAKTHRTRHVTFVLFCIMDCVSLFVCGSLTIQSRPPQKSSANTLRGRMLRMSFGAFTAITLRTNLGKPLVYFASTL